MKTTDSNEKIMLSFKQMAHIANQNPNFEILANNLSNF
jgi:hypothetical protein